MNLQQNAADLFGIDLNAQQTALFERYLEELLDWNTRINLTAITEPTAVETRHFLDSLSLVQAVTLKEGDSLLDVGSGAGFPGLPLAIVFAGIQVTLLETTGKKVDFMNRLIDHLGLNNAKAVKARAEDAGQDPQHREKYDVVTARAVARLPALLEYTLPLVRVGGWFIAMKGTTAQAEVDDATRALKILGGTCTGIQAITLPDIEDTHYLIQVQKQKPTPRTYPRRAGIPTREPL